eukprot:1101683-Pyramimonas_sp.AAC.1
MDRSLGETQQRWIAGFNSAIEKIKEWQPDWRPVAESLLQAPPHRMAKELVANKMLKLLGETTADIDARIAMARKHVGVFPQQD